MMTTLGALSLLAAPLSAKSTASTPRFADFRRCFMESEFGKKEQENLQEMQKQMEKSIGDLSAQIKEVQDKLANEDVLDSLSEEAVANLKTQQDTLMGEMQRYQMQFPQIVQQAQSQSVFAVREKAKEAAKELAAEKKYSAVLNEDQAFFFEAKLDVTDEVIKKLNAKFEQEQKEESAKVAKSEKAKKKADKNDKK